MSISQSEKDCDTTSTAAVSVDEYLAFFPNHSLILSDSAGSEAAPSFSPHPPLPLHCSPPTSIVTKELLETQEALHLKQDKFEQTV